MKIATYNIQNIFYRDRALIKKYREENKELWVEEFENLMIKGTLAIDKVAIKNASRKKAIEYWVYLRKDWIAFF